MAKAGRKPRKDIPWPQVKARYMAGDDSVRSIARDYGIDDSTIIRKAQKENWQKSAQIKQHIEQRAELEAKRSELIRKESGLPPQIQYEITRQVFSRAAWIERFSVLQGTLMQDVLNMWDHDKKVNPVLGEEHCPTRYGKAKIVQEVIEKGKKMMVGDEPLFDDGDGSDDEDWGIVIPHQEAVRLAEVEERLNKKEDDE